MNVEERLRIDSHAGPFLDRAAASARLLARLTARHSSWKAASSASGSMRAELVQMPIQPSPMRRVMSAVSCGLLSAIQRRGVTPLVTFRNFSGATGGSRASTVCFSRSECSAATPLMAWLPTRAPGAPCARSAARSRRSATGARARVVAGVARADFVEKAAIDLEDDLQVPRQQRAEERERPLLQRFGQQRVIGVGAACLRDRPRPRPNPCRARPRAAASARRSRSTGCVSFNCAAQLRREARRASRPRRQMQANHVLQRAGDEEVLLRQPQSLAGLRLVVRIEHLGDGLGRTFWSTAP